MSFEVFSVNWTGAAGLNQFLPELLGVCRWLLWVYCWCWCHWGSYYMLSKKTPDSVRSFPFWSGTVRVSSMPWSWVRMSRLSNKEEWSIRIAETCHSKPPHSFGRSSRAECTLHPRLLLPVALLPFDINRWLLRSFVFWNIHSLYFSTR